MPVLVESFLWHGKDLFSGTVATDSGKSILRGLLGKVTLPILLLPLSSNSFHFSHPLKLSLK